MSDDDLPVPIWAGEAFEDEEDDGLAAERTELAWGRSSLSLMVCGVAVARGVSRISGQASHPFVGAVVLVFGALAWGAGLPYARTRAIAVRTSSIVKLSSMMMSARASIVTSSQR